ncbi:unnamed protein product [Calypogeia fissa]
MSIATDVASINVERTTQEQLQRIKDFSLPNFVPPYPYKRSPFAEKATAEANRWVEEFSLDEVYNSPEELRGLYKADFPGLAMVVYVDCGEREAIWAAKFFIWLFIFDDRLDDITNFCAPEKSTAIFLELNAMVMWSFPDDELFYNKFVEFLDEGDVAERDQCLNFLHSKLDEARLKLGTVYKISSPDVHPLCKSFQDLWTPLCEAIQTDSLRRWALLFQDQLLANVREIRNRKNNTIPSVDDYITCRRDGVALRTSSVSVEFLDKVHVPDEVFDCPEMQRFLLATNDAISWHNDLWSFQKEALIGDVHNLVIVVSHAQQCSYAEAGAKVYQMMMSKLAEMEEAIGDLEKVTPPEHQHAISRYFHWARNFVTGSHYWHDSCTRYTKFA